MTEPVSEKQKRLFQAREAATDEVNSYDNLARYLDGLTPKTGKDRYLCPLCGKKSLVIQRSYQYPGQGVAFVNCCQGRKPHNLIQLEQLFRGRDFTTARDALIQRFGTSFDQYDTEAAIPPPITPQKLESGYFREVKDDGTKAKYQWDRYEKANERLLEIIDSGGDISFLRGLSRETIELNRVGIVGKPGHRRLIFPATVYQHRERPIDTGKKEYFVHPSGLGVTPYGLDDLFIDVPDYEGTWNEPNEIVFVTEGEFDMLSIVDCGGNAISLGGTPFYKRFAAYCEEHPPQCGFIVAFDNDESGREYQDRLVDGLQRLGIRAYGANVETLYFGHKDPSEAFQADRERLKQGLVDEIEIADAEWRRHPQSPNSKHSLTATSIAQNGEKRKHFDEKSDPYTEEKEDIYKALNL